MNIICRAHISDYKKIKKKLKELILSDANFYSEFNENIFYYIICSKCLLIKNNGDIKAALIIKKGLKQIIYIPLSNKCISFFKLLFLLTKHIHVKDYTIHLKHKNINALKYKKYFSYCIVEDIKIMKGFTDILPINDYNKLTNTNFKVMELNKDEDTRVELQNNIFRDIKGRRTLTIDEVKREEIKPGFIKNMCYIIEVSHLPAGYGQILMLDNKFYLVNFGILPEYRQAGLGYHFLNQILYSCFENGLDYIYLSVDNNNDKAIKLYEKAGFKQEYNMLTIKI